ncbi:Ornithine carbamoyltransferase [Bienertia sinuspersici]
MAGYELARKLESCGVWRTWLGDSLYSNFVHFLSSPSSWEAFMASQDSNSNSKSNIQLQLRVRALLFDKALLSLFPSSSLSLSSSSSSSSSPLLNPSYLQLHADDVYFTLEDAVPQRDSKVQSQRFRQEDFPDTWYNQFIEKYRTSKPYMVSLPNQESDKRNPSGMSNYLKLLERHKRRRTEFKEDENGGFGNSNSENIMQPNTILDEDTSGSDSTYFFPETMFMMNCVPENTVAPRMASDDKQKLEFFGVLDTLPQVATKSSIIMLERFGVRPEYLEQGPGQSRTKVGLDGNRKQLGQEQAMQISKKVVARVLTKVGFEGSSEIPVQVLSQFLSCHISKLGHILKVLTDSYKKHCSAIELLKMFLHMTGNSNLASLAEYLKDNRNIAQQTSQQIQGMQPQLSLPQQNTLQLPQQMPRQMNPQLPQVAHPHNLTLQQQQQFERMQRRQAPSPRPVMSMEKDRPMVEIKQETPPDLSSENNALNAMNNRNAQIWRQQQVLQRFIGSGGNQMRQPASVQLPQMQSQNIGTVRAPPVKVEGFQELMGGDTSMKHTPDENKLTSPSKKKQKVSFDKLSDTHCQYYILTISLRSYQICPQTPPSMIVQRSV